MAGSKMKVAEELVDGEKIVRVRMSCRNPVAFFLLLWWSFWTFGVVTALKKVVSDPSIIVWLLIALPADVVVFWFMMLMFFGKRVITLGGGKGSVFTGVGPVGFTKRFACDRTARLLIEERECHSKRGTYTQYELMLRNYTGPAKDVRIFSDTERGSVEDVRDALVKGLGLTDAVPSVREAAEAEPEPSEAEPDLSLLSARPPEGLKVDRDFEGRTKATCRWMLFGRRELKIGQGEGVRFIGFGPFGFRKRFGCGYGYDVRIVDSGCYVNGRRLKEILITRRDDPESSTRICAFWPDDMKPYLAALLSRG